MKGIGITKNISRVRSMIFTVLNLMIRTNNLRLSNSTPFPLRVRTIRRLLFRFTVTSNTNTLRRPVHRNQFTVISINGGQRVAGLESKGLYRGELAEKVGSLESIIKELRLLW